VVESGFVDLIVISSRVSHPYTYYKKFLISTFLSVGKGTGLSFLTLPHIKGSLFNRLYNGSTWSHQVLISHRTSPHAALSRFACPGEIYCLFPPKGVGTSSLPKPRALLLTIFRAARLLYT